jgi:hypothetical protein
MVAQVALAELLLGLAVMVALVGLAGLVVVRTLATSPSLVVSRRVVLLHPEAEDDGFLEVLATYLRRHGCQIHEPEVRWLGFDAVNLFAELPLGIDCVVSLTVEAVSGQRIDVRRIVDTYSVLSIDMLPIPVEMPVVDYTVFIRMRNLRGEFYRQTLYPFRWAISAGNTAAEDVGEEIINVLAGVAQPNTEAEPCGEAMVR